MEYIRDRINYRKDLQNILSLESQELICSEEEIKYTETLYNYYNEKIKNFMQKIKQSDV